MSRLKYDKNSDLDSELLTELAFSDGGSVYGHHLYRKASGNSSYSAFGIGKKPPIQHQASLVIPRTPIVFEPDSASHYNRMGTQDIDQNIFHWKSLNLSRAKLKASSRTSALLSGFAMVAMVEIQIDDTIPESLLIAFAVCTVLLISVHMLALMISTCILPNVEAVSNLHLQTPNTVLESPHHKMSFIIELAWGFSTVIGILLFLVEIMILCWVKFSIFNHQAVAWVATGLLIPIICIFLAFAAHFYLKLVGHKSELYEHNMKELELLKDQLDEGTTNQDQDSAAGDSTIKIV